MCIAVRKRKTVSKITIILFNSKNKNGISICNNLKYIQTLNLYGKIYAAREQ